MLKDIGECIACGYSMSIIWAFNNIENKYTLYLGRDSIKKFCKSLRDHARYVIDFGNKQKMLLLPKHQLRSH